jgi:hypothetical protein
MAPRTGVSCCLLRLLWFSCQGLSIPALESVAWERLSDGIRQDMTGIVTPRTNLPEKRTLPPGDG